MYSAPMQQIIKSSSSSGVLIVGMTCVDTVWKCNEQIQPRGKSNFAKLSKSVGGVGANLARAVARCDKHRQTTFVTAVGTDSDGRMAMEELSKELNIIPSPVSDDDVTGQYMCVAQNDGELYVAAQDMAIADRIDAQIPDSYFANCAAVLVDFNISRAALGTVLSSAGSKRIFLDPTSIFRIPDRFDVLPELECCFPNVAELYTFKLLACGEEVDFDNVSKVEDRVSSLAVDDMMIEIREMVNAIYSSKLGGPAYFVVTAAEHGAFYGKQILPTAVSWKS